MSLNIVKTIYSFQNNIMRHLFCVAILLLVIYIEVEAHKITTSQAGDKILFIVSNAHFYGDSDLNTANHFAEIVFPYDKLIKAGYTVDFVSPEGGAIPLGYIQTSDPLIKQYLYDNDFMDLLESTKKPSDIQPADYKAVYYGGGGAAMFGVPENKAIQKIVMNIYEQQQGIISAVCHGSAGLVNLKTKDGQHLVAGKKVNGFPDMFENMKANYYKTFPFSIEQAIQKNGGDFQYSKEGWDGFVVADGRLITGQDPTSAALVADKLIELLGTPASTSSSLDKTKRQKLDELFQSDENQPGLVVAIYSEGKELYKKTVGAANLDSARKINSNTVFDIGSLSMHFTAACIVLLEGEDKLSLDDPISKHLPELPNYAEGQPTIRHLLHHTSGLRDYIIALDMTKNTFDIHYDKQQGLDFLIQQKELGFTPGQEYEYSNSNYLLLNHIVSSVSGQSLNDFAQEKIFKPLGMQHTFFLEEAGKVVKNRAIGYQKEGEEATFQQSHFFNFAAAGDGRLHTTLDDFIKWMQHFKQPKIGQPNFIEQLLKRGIENDGDIMSYALGLEHGTSDGFNFFGHNGYWGATSSFFMRFPQADLSIVVFSNNGTISSPRKAFQAVSILLHDQEPKEITDSLEDQATVKQTNEQLQDWTGNYIAYKTGYLRKILVKNDTLIYQIAENNERRLIPIGNGAFRVLGSQIYSVQFKKTATGQKVMQFIREGITQYEYTTYEPSKPSTSDFQSLAGRYYSEALNIFYDLSVDKEELVVTVNGKEYMRYRPIMKNIFGSTSGHHGYFTFDKNKQGETFFVMNDYSMKKLKFERK